MYLEKACCAGLAREIVEIDAVLLTGAVGDGMMEVVEGGATWIVETGDCEEGC